MAEDEHVPGSTASLEGRAEDSAVARAIRDHLLSRLQDVIDKLPVPVGSVDTLTLDLHPSTLDFLGFDHKLSDGFVLGGHHWVLELGVRAQRDHGDAVPWEARLLLQVKRVRELDQSSDLPSSFRSAFAVTHVRQPALPGLDDLVGQRAGSSDRGLLVSAAILEGLGAETLSRLHDRIAETMPATEVPIRALRNPGKVLGELAEKGEVARVTNHGKIVGWLMPATEAEQHLDDLLKQGRLRRGTPAPIEPIDVEGLETPLSEALSQARDGERT